MLDQIEARLEAAKRLICNTQLRASLSWGPTPGVPDGYGYWLDGDYCGSLDAALDAIALQRINDVSPPVDPERYM